MRAPSSSLFRSILTAPSLRQPYPASCHLWFPRSRPIQAAGQMGCLNWAYSTGVTLTRMKAAGCSPAWPAVRKVRHSHSAPIGGAENSGTESALHCGGIRAGDLGYDKAPRCQISGPFNRVNNAIHGLAHGKRESQDRVTTDDMHQRIAARTGGAGGRIAVGGELDQEGRRTMPTTRSPALNELRQERIDDTTEGFMPQHQARGAWRRPAILPSTISTSVPQTPTAIASTKTRASLTSGSGKSSYRAVPAFFGSTVIAFID